MNPAAVPSLPDALQIWVEFCIAGLVCSGMVAYAMLTIRSRHRDTGAWHVYAGAAIQGLVYGAIVGFFIVPLRMAMMSGDLPTQFTGPTTLAAFALLIAMRRGLFSHLPFLGPQVRAYRRAALRRGIEVAQTQLSKLTPAGMAAAGGVL